MHCSNNASHLHADLPKHTITMQQPAGGKARAARSCRGNQLPLAALPAPSCTRNVMPAARSRSTSSRPMAAAGEGKRGKSKRHVGVCLQQQLPPSQQLAMASKDSSTMMCQDYRPAPAAGAAPEAGVSTPPLCTSAEASNSRCCSARHSAASSAMRLVPLRQSSGVMSSG